MRENRFPMVYKGTNKPLESTQYTYKLKILQLIYRQLNTIGEQKVRLSHFFSTFWGTYRELHLGAKSASTTIGKGELYEHEKTSGRAHRNWMVRYRSDIALGLQPLVSWSFSPISGTERKLLFVMF